MKVLHLIDSGGLYGAEKMLLSLVEEQLKQGLDSMILSAGARNIEEKALEVEARRLGLPVIVWRMKPGFNLMEGKKIIAWAQKQGYELMHSHGYKFNILIGLWPPSKRPPLVTTLHGYVRARRFSKMWFYELLDRWVLPRMERVVLVDQLMKADLKPALQNSERVHVIPNGVGIREIRGRAEEKPNSKLDAFLEAHAPVILGVGRLSREKAFERLIETFSAIRDRYPLAGLLIVGEGKMRYDLESLIEQYDLTAAVLMAGFCDNVPSLMARANVLAITSRTEGLPITLLEAMTLELPVVASAVGAIPEVLDQGKGGWLVHTPEIDHFANAIIECLKNDNQRSLRVRTANSKVQKAYSSSSMASAYRNVYQLVVS